MINLLPPEDKKTVEREYLFRLVSAYIFLVSTAVFIGAVLLLPSYFFASTQEKAAEAELIQLESSSESIEREAISEQLLETKEKLVTLTSVKDKEPIFTLIDTISTYSGRGVDVSNVSYTRGDSESRLSVGGVAATRDALLRFQRSLEEDERFNDVQFPVSILAEEEDIKFTIQISGEF